MMTPKILILILMILIISSAFLAESPSNIPAPGCAGGGCHSMQEGIVSATQLSNLQVQVAIAGVKSGKKIAAELVDNKNNIVDVIHSTQNNPPRPTFQAISQPSVKTLFSFTGLNHTGTPLSAKIYYLKNKETRPER